MAVEPPAGVPASTPILAAAAGALFVAPMRSLPICLAGGLAAYALATLAG